jgi:hypothetical protein
MAGADVNRRRRSSPLFAASLFASAAVLVGACHGPPDEKLTAHDGGGSAISASGTPIVDAAVPPLPPPPDAGRADLRAFCNDAYGADDARMAQKCTVKDMGVQRGLARAAANLCADDMNSAVLHARASFDADAASHCIAMLRSTPLERTSDTDTLFAHYPCDGVLVGSQPEGQPCRFSVECKEGLACEGYAIGVDGVCKAPPKAGEACIIQRFGNILNVAAIGNHHPACAPGLWCDGSKCQPLAAAGKACGSTASCAGGLACVGGKCARPGGEGAACNTSAECAFGSFCDHGPGSTRPTCTAKRAAGAPCTSTEACKGRCDMTDAIDAGAFRIGKCAEVCGSG